MASTLTMPARLDSLSSLARSLQVPVTRLMRAVEELKIEPALQIDATPYFAEQQAEQLRIYLVIPDPSCFVRGEPEPKNVDNC